MPQHYGLSRRRVIRLSIEEALALGAGEAGRAALAIDEAAGVCAEVEFHKVAAKVRFADVVERPGHIVFARGHPDPIRSAAAPLRATGATPWMHPADAPPAASGGPFRPVRVGRGLDG